MSKLTKPDKEVSEAIESMIAKTRSECRKSEVPILQICLDLNKRLDAQFMFIDSIFGLVMGISSLTISQERNLFDSSRMLCKECNPSNLCDRHASWGKKVSDIEFRLNDLRSNM